MSRVDNRGVLQLLDATTHVQRARLDFDVVCQTEKTIGRAAYSSGGKLLATADRSTSGWEVVLRDPATGAGSPIETNAAGLDFAFTPDGRSILTSNEGQGSALVQWDLETPPATRTFPGTGGGAVAVSPDGRS